MSMKFLKTAASYWKKVSGNVILKDSSASVGIGTDSPEKLLELNVDGSNGNPQMTFQNDAIKYYVGVAGTDNDNFNFYDATNTRTPIAIIASGGHLKLGVGNLIIGTAGQGIDFSAQTATTTGTTTAELLNHYEEGTFTATIADAASGGNEGSTSTGTYTRIGRTCHFRIGYVNLDTTGLTSGNKIHITGFPFVGTGGNGHVTPLAISYLSTPSTAQGYVASGTNYALLVAGTSTGSWPYVLVSGLTSGSADLYFNGTYTVVV